MNKISLLVLLLCFCACHPDKMKKEPVENLRFETTDASELFFKNVRRSDYQQEELREARLDVFRLADWDASQSLISPAIIINWGMDRAFFMLEKPDSVETIYFVVSDSVSADTIPFDGSTQRRHAEVALHLYNAMLDKKELSLLLPDKEMTPLFTSEEKEQYRRMVFDFLRLVELR